MQLFTSGQLLNAALWLVGGNTALQPESPTGYNGSMYRWLLLLRHIDHLLLLSLLQMKTVVTIRAFYLETSHCAACWSSNYQKCCSCYKLTCSSPVQSSAHPKSTAGPGLCFMQRGEEGAGAFLNVASIQPWQSPWRNGTRSCRRGTNGQVGRGCKNEGQRKQEWCFCQSSEDLWVRH